MGELVATIRGMSALTVAVTSSKGGVLKTSLVANVAGLAAAGGWRVLCVDADPQGDLRHDLGYGERSDHGRSLARGLLTGERPAVLADVRPGLDVVAGGVALRAAIDALHDRGDTSRADADVAGHDVLRHFGDYDLVLVDTPPGDVVLRRQLTAHCAFSVVPTAPDAASMAGLVSIAEDLRAAVRINPHHELLAVVLGPVGSGARDIRRAARHRLSDLLDRPAPVLMATIRLAQKVAVDCRAAGQLVMEYEAAAAGADSPHGWRTRRDRREYSSAASGLASDYQELTDELLERLVNRPLGGAFSAA